MKSIQKLGLSSLVIAGGVALWYTPGARQWFSNLTSTGRALLPKQAADISEGMAAIAARATSFAQQGTAGTERSTRLEAAADPGPASTARPAPPQPVNTTEGLALRNSPDAGQLEAFGDDETTNDRVLSRLGRFIQAEGLNRLTINTQAGGVAFLRGTVRSQAQIDQILKIVEETRGVGDIVNELQIAQEDE